MIEGKRKALQQVVYTFGNIVGLGLAVYKCQVMGLLPTHPSDWLAFVEPQKVKSSYRARYLAVSASVRHGICSDQFPYMQPLRMWRNFSTFYFKFRCSDRNFIFPLFALHS